MLWPIIVCKVYLTIGSQVHRARQNGKSQRANRDEQILIQLTQKESQKADYRVDDRGETSDGSIKWVRTQKMIHWR